MTNCDTCGLNAEFKCDNHHHAICSNCTRFTGCLLCDFQVNLSCGNEDIKRCIECRRNFVSKYLFYHLQHAHGYKDDQTETFPFVRYLCGTPLSYAGISFDLSMKQFIFFTDDDQTKLEVKMSAPASWTFTWNDASEDLFMQTMEAFYPNIQIELTINIQTVTYGLVINTKPLS